MDPVSVSTPFQYEGVSMEAYEDKHAEEQRRYLGDKANASEAELPGQKVSSTLLEG